jgi:hypothetical protein
LAFNEALHETPHSRYANIISCAALQLKRFYTVWANINHRAGRRKMRMLREIAAACGKDRVNHDDCSLPPPCGASIIL